MIFGVPVQILLGQILLGLINGAFYALLSLGLAIIFGMLNIINFAHGTLFMLGAFVAWAILEPNIWLHMISPDLSAPEWLSIGYWPALIIVPIVVGAFGMLLEKTVISRLYRLDHLYGLLLTFGLSLVIEGLIRNAFGSSGMPYRIPYPLQGGLDLGFMFMPSYRGWVVVAALVVCLGTWLLIEKTSLGANLRAATESPKLVQAFGLNVPRMVTLTYAAGVALAAFAGVLAAPIYSVDPNMGSDFIMVVFAVVVIGGMGSILGSIVAGFGLGLVEALTKVYYPQGSSTVIFVVMTIVLLVRPADQSARSMSDAITTVAPPPTLTSRFNLFGFRGVQAVGLLVLALLVVVSPFFVYRVFLMEAMCFALFACAFNLLIGFGGLLSLGHAAFFGMGSYIAAWTAKQWGLTPELAILAGACVGGAMGALTAWIAIRRRGLYFAMITLALAQMVYFFCLQAPFTGGEDGIQQVPRGALLGLFPLADDKAMYAFVSVIFLFFFILIHRVIHSPFGQVLKAIRENEARAISLGYPTDNFKLITFTLSAFIAGIAGGLSSIVFSVATLTDVNFSTSGDVVLITLLGGLGTVFGPLAGAVIVKALEQYLSVYGSWVTVTEGLIFVACVLVFRRGILGEIAARLRVRL
jgi:branched-chain amino acid transport system permease protein